MKRKTTLALLLVFALAFSEAVAEQPAVRWMSFTEAVALSQKQPKKIFVDIYTSWCGICRRMDASTFLDTAVASYINEHFYAVKLNAETRDSIPFRGHVFAWDSAYKANDLAVTLLNGQMGYPSFVYLDEQFNLITTVSGYQSTEQLLPALRYFYEDRFRSQTFEEYMKAPSPNGK